MPGYSQLARLEPTVFRRRSRRLQLTSLEQLPKSKTANLITSSALRWECPVNGITSVPLLVKPGAPKGVEESVDIGHVFTPSRFAPQGDAVNAVGFVSQRVGKLLNVVVSGLLWHGQALSLQEVLAVHEH